MTPEQTQMSVSHSPLCVRLPEESLEGEDDDDDDYMSQSMRQRATIPWRSCGTYLSSAGPLILSLLLLSQLVKHTLMVAIDYWLAHWTSRVITAKVEASASNCTVAQVRRLLLSTVCLSNRIAGKKWFESPLESVASPAFPRKT